MTTPPPSRTDGDFDPQHPGRIPLSSHAWIAAPDLRFSFSRASGPGGQAVNKLSTRAELRVHLNAVMGLDDAALQRLRALAGRRLTADDELILHAQTSRSQLDNKRACVQRLRELVAKAAIPPKIRKAVKPTRAMKRKRLASKRAHSEKKARRRSRLDE